MVEHEVAPKLDMDIDTFSCVWFEYKIRQKIAIDIIAHLKKRMRRKKNQRFEISDISTICNGAFAATTTILPINVVDEIKSTG